MASVLKLLRTIEVDEVNPNKKSTFDLLFERLREYKPEHIALKQYDAFKIVADKTMKSIVISAYSHLFLFNLKSVNSLTEESTIDFSNLHQRKTALYIILDDMDSSMNPIASVFLSQLFQILIRDADNSSKQRLDIPIHFFLDDFCGYQIKDFYKIIACARSRGIGISLFLQSESQLESIYGKSNSHTIINCCDTYLYLGGSDISTCENISKRTEQSLKNILEMPIGHLWILEEEKNRD